MGAVFISKRVDAKVSRQDLTKQFRQWQEDAAHENGHSYSGDWNMLSGLIIDDRHFPSIEEADDWLSEHCQKWEAAQAVRATQLEPAPPLYGGKPGTVWLDGFSILRQRNYVDQKDYFCDQLTAAEKKRAATLLDDRAVIQGDLRDATRMLDAVVSRIKNVNTPIEGVTMATINHTRRRVARVQKALDRNTAALQPIADALRARLNKAGSTREVWLVGGWAAS